MRLQNTLLLILALTLLIAPGAIADTRIRCASTTSTQNSGLLDYLLPLFEKKTGIHVDVVAVGTGAALEIGKRGDADLLMVHAKQDELRMVREGWFINRHDVMYNDFVLVGPPEDPAGIATAKTAQDAFQKIFRTRVPFASRGDNSGTNKKEISIWKHAGLSPEGTSWYLKVGQGMAKTLRIADEKGAYTLTDRGTWLALYDRERMHLKILFEGDPLLFNQYGVMAVNPKRHPYVKYKEAMSFIRWIISPEGQNAIAAYRDRTGHVLFHPNANVR